MKIIKFYIFLFLIFFSSNVFSSEFWSNEIDGPTSNEAAIKMLQGKKLDPIEGLWFTDGLGTLLIFKDQNEFKMYIVEGPTDFNGTLEATIFKRGNNYDFIGKVWYTQTDGSYDYGSQSGQLELFENYFIQKYDSLSKEGVDMDHKVTRVWPEDIFAYNENFKTKEKVQDGKSKNVDKEVNNIIEKKEDQTTKDFYALNWFNLNDPKDHYAEIPNSNSEVYILETEIYIKGQEEIDKFSNILFNEPASSNDMVVIDNEDYGYTIYIKYLNEGYVSLEDWENVDSKKFLEEMNSNAQQTINDVSWVFVPKINENKNVTYSYKINWKNGETTLETKILALGRKGYHDIAVVKKITDNFNSKEFEEFALEFANTINFNEGFRHSDYKSGDKIAALTIGGLVAGSLGVKTLAKAGFLAKILPFLIKFWWVILAPIVGLIGIWSKNKKDNNQTQTKTRARRKKKD